MIAENVINENTEMEVQIEADYPEETVDVKQYSITGYGVDYDVEGIVKRYKRGDIEIPKFQRTYVWPVKRASRFIESLLMGLPVPGIFLYREKGSQKLRVIDGQQRLMTLHYFYDGQFKDSAGPFTLKGLESRFNDLAYSDLLDEDKRRLNDSIIHASIIQQESPDDDGSSQFAIFERLNTTSTSLSPQEIRAAIYGGDFNRLLEDLNENADWRELFGKPNPRKRDQELILRFLALHYGIEDYRPPMKEFLNDFMRFNRNLQEYPETEIRDLFEGTMSVILEKLGPKAFKPQRAVNAALLDSLSIGIAGRLAEGCIDADLRQAYGGLLNDESFRIAIYAGTAQTDNVRTRVSLAIDAFAGVE